MLQGGCTAGRLCEERSVWRRSDDAGSERDGALILVESGSAAARVAFGWGDGRVEGGSSCTGSRADAIDVQQKSSGSQGGVFERDGAHLWFPFASSAAHGWLGASNGVRGTG